MSIKENPLISILINNYNYGLYLSQAIDSALNQTYGNVEVVVVDDGSTDQSREIVRSYGNCISSVLKENGGQASAINAGFLASKGEIVCFLDADDSFLPCKVEEIVKIFTSIEDIGWCFHSLKLVDENDQPLSMTTTENYLSRCCDFRNLIEKGKIPPSLPSSSALCFQRSLLEEILPMPASKVVSCSDHYIKFMAVALAKGYISDKALTLQKIHGQNAATLRPDKLYSKAREHFFTSCCIKQQFPQYKKFANKWFSVGVALSWESNVKNLENYQMVESFLNSASVLERYKISLRAFFYYIKKRKFFLGI